MTFEKRKEGTKLFVSLAGRLDTLSAPILSDALAEEKDYADIEFDFAALEYLSSSGLRLLFSCRKALGGKEHVVVKNVNDVIMEIFRVTGFDKQIEIQ